MCLATVYGKKKEGESILIKNASRMDVDGTTIRIRDIMGAEIEVEELPNTTWYACFMRNHSKESTEVVSTTTGP